MSLTTSRITSNVAVHGVRFAVMAERSRFARRGFSARTAGLMAVRAVHGALAHAGVITCGQR